MFGSAQSKAKVCTLVVIYFQNEHSGQTSDFVGALLKGNLRY